MATWAGPGSVPQIEVVRTFAPLVERIDSGELAVVGVDMPIGLAAGARTADAAARDRLGRRRSSLFATPTFAAVGAEDYPAASAANRAAGAGGLSKQAWMLVPKIREVREVLLGDPDRAVFEVHPETSFAVLAGAPLEHPKRDAAGVVERERWLVTVGLWPADGVEHAVGAGMDDVYDALAAAWTAHRIATGAALALGDADARDPTGFRLTIWA